MQAEADADEDARQHEGDDDVLGRGQRQGMARVAVGQVVHILRLDRGAERVRVVEKRQLRVDVSVRGERAESRGTAATYIVHAGRRGEHVRVGPVAFANVGQKRLCACARLQHRIEIAVVTGIQRRVPR